MICGQRQPMPGQMLLAGRKGQSKKLTRAAELWASGQLEDDEPTDADAGFDAALAAFGLCPDGAGAAPSAPIDIYYLWPDCVPVWNAWVGLQTQWRTGGRDGIKTGLDYSAVAHYLRFGLGAAGGDLAEWFACLQAMEQATLSQWARQRPG